MWTTSLSRTLDTLLSLQDAVDHAQHNDFFGVNTTSRGVEPSINLFEKEGDLVAFVELPGIQKEDLKLEVKGNHLRISGERRIEYGKGVSKHRIERKEFRFDRTVKLPFTIEQDQIEANYENGLLTVTMPRAESDKPKQIVIN